MKTGLVCILLSAALCIAKPAVRSGNGVLNSASYLLLIRLFQQAPIGCG